MHRGTITGFLILASALVLACSSTPSSTVESMRKAACEASVEKFFSHVDKPSVDENLKKSFMDHMKANVDPPENEWEAWGQSLGESLASTMVDSLPNMMWSYFEADIRKGKDGVLCKLEVVGQGKENNTLRVKFGEAKETTLGFGEVDGKWKLTSIVTDEFQQHAGSDTNPVVKMAPEKTEEELVEEFAEDDGDYNFRKTRWGMTPEEVKRREKSAPSGRIDNEIHYEDTVAGLKVQVGYIFYADKLVTGGYMVNERHSNDNQYINDYERLKKALTAKYGQPKEDETLWTRSLYKNKPEEYGFAVSLGDLAYYAKWDTPETEIGLYLTGDNYRISLFTLYESKELQYLKVEKEQKELDDKL